MFFSEINEIKTVLHPHQFCLFLHHNVSLNLNFNCLACPFEFLVIKKVGNVVIFVLHEFEIISELVIVSGI